MIRALQAGFRGGIGKETLIRLKTLGVQGVRLDCRFLPPETVAELAHEALDLGLLALMIVSDAAEIRKLPVGTHVEIGAEPDINNVPPALMAARIKHLHETAEPLGVRIWAPTVSNLNERGLTYLREIMPMLPLSVNISVHRYPHDRFLSTGPEVAHDGSASREEEVRKLKAIIGPRAWGVTEFGYHTAPRPRKLFGINLGTRRWTDQQVEEYVRWEWRFWEQMGAEFAILFQINDGPQDIAEHRYGIRRVDGTFKLVAGTFQR